MYSILALHDLRYHLLTRLENCFIHFSSNSSRRGVWIPTTSWEALWYGVTQWIGITDDAAINYVLPNARNFGCNLYSEADLFTDGTATVSGCGGDVITVQQIFLVSEPRVLSPDEQTAYIDLITKTSPVSVRCLIVSQILRVLPAGSRMLNTGNTTYELDVVSEVSFESGEDGETIYTESIDTVTFQEEAASVVQMDDVVVEQAEVVVVTSSPSKSPCEYETSSLLFERFLDHFTHFYAFVFVVCSQHLLFRRNQATAKTRL